MQQSAITCEGSMRSIKLNKLIDKWVFLHVGHMPLNADSVQPSPNSRAVNQKISKMETGKEKSREKI